LQTQTATAALGANRATGNGGNATATAVGVTKTTNAEAPAVVAQSVGGGGGLIFGSSTLTLALGGTNGAAGNGGTVTASVGGQVTTSGTGSFGLFAQSVGGGGGAAFTSATTTSQSGGSGSGGTVTATAAGKINTTGAGADGIFAQSVGGGGGFAGTPSASFAGSAGGSGAGGNITVTLNSASISTQGANAIGIYAQSAGGASGTGGNISTTVLGAINAQKAAAIVEQSTGGAGAGALSINVIAKSTILGGIGGTTAPTIGNGTIDFLGGSSATLTNAGQITAVSRGYAVLSSAPGTTIVNNGGIMGSIGLAAGGTNSVTNNAKFASGTVVDLAGGTLTNNGTLLPGELGGATTTAAAVLGAPVTSRGLESFRGTLDGAAATNTNATTIDGNFVQTSSGTIDASVDLANGQADQLIVDGNATLAGTVAVTMLDTGAATPGTHVFDVLSATGTLDETGLTVTGPVSDVTSYALVKGANGQIDVSETIDFDPKNLRGPAARFGRYLDQIQNDGSAPGFTTMVAEAVDASDKAVLTDVYDEFTPESYAAVQEATLKHAMQFSQELLSSKAPVWGSFDDTYASQIESDTTLGYADRTVGVHVGVQGAIDRSQRTLLGGGIGVDSDVISAHTTTLSGTNVMAGAFIKRIVGNGVTVSAEVSGGSTSYNATHNLDYGSPTLSDADGPTALPAATYATPSLMGSATASAGYLSGALRADAFVPLSHGFGIAPYLAVISTRVLTGAIAESGAGALDVDVSAQSGTYVALQPGFDIGGSVAGKTGSVRPDLAVAVTQLLGAPVIGLSGMLQGAPAGIGAVAFDTGIDRTVWSATPSLDISGRDMTVRVSGSFVFSDHYHSSSVQLEITKKFGRGH
jgi:hypothetical protein